MRNFYFGCVAALLLLVGAAFAGGPTYQFVAIPASPTAGETIQIQVNVGPSACNLLPAILAVEMLPGNVIRLDLAGSDGCTPNLPAQQSTYDIGGFAAGTYVFRLADCGSNPPPGGGDSCVTLAEQSIAISGEAGGPQAVPGLSIAGMLALGLLVLGAGVTVMNAAGRARG